MSKRVLSNLLIMGSSQVVTWTMSSMFLVILSRYLGPDRLGELMLAQATVGILGLVLGLGMNPWIVRSVARTPERASAIVTSALVVRAVVALLVPLVLAVYVHSAHLNVETSTASYVYAIGMVFSLWSEALLAVFQGHENMSLVALSSVLFKLVGLVFVVLIALLHGGVVTFAVGSSINFLLILVLNAYWAQHHFNLHWQFAWSDLREVVKGSFAFWATTLFHSYYTYVDGIILGLLAGSQALGFYSPATRLYQVAMFLPSITMAVTLPSFSRLGLDAGIDFTEAGRKTLSLLMVCAVPLTVGLVTFAGPLIGLMFGESYRPAVPVLEILGLCVPCTYVNIVFYQLLVARDQQMRWTWAMGASCIVNPLLNLALIPLAVEHWHNGAIGAALALLITEVAMAIYGAIILRELVAHTSIGRAFTGAIASGIVQAAVIFFAQSQSLLQIVVVQVLAGCLYLTLAIFFGALPYGDFVLLWRTALRRPRRAAAPA